MLLYHYGHDTLVKMKILPLFLLVLLTTSCNHAVILQWKAPINSIPAPTSYNVYRAPCLGVVINANCSSEGAFTSIGGTNGLNFADSAVVVGMSYAYYVTSVAADGRESVPSNHVAATIPSASGAQSLKIGQDGYCQANSKAPQCKPGDEPTKTGIPEGAEGR